MYNTKVLPSYGKRNKLIMRIFIDGVIEPTLSMWSFDYIDKGLCPLQFGSYSIPMDDLVGLYKKAYPKQKFPDVVTNSCTVSNTIHSTTRSYNVDTSISKVDVIITAIRNCNGNTDVLLKCLELNTSNEVLNEVISNCNGDTSIIMMCLSLLEENKTVAPKPIINDTPDDAVNNVVILDTSTDTIDEFTANNDSFGDDVIEEDVAATTDESVVNNTEIDVETPNKGIGESKRKGRPRAKVRKERHTPQ